MFRALALALAVVVSAPLAHAQAFKPRGDGTTAAPKKPAAKPKPVAKKPRAKLAAAKKPKSKPVAKKRPRSEPGPGSPDYVHFIDDE